MDAPRTPDSLSTQAENELICEKLLGWKPRKCFSPYDGRFMGNDFLDGRRETTAPSFTTWADAGLILDALFDKSPVVWKHPDGWQAHFDKPWEWTIQSTGPLAIRAAALEYMRNQS